MKDLFIILILLFIIGCGEQKTNDSFEETFSDEKTAINRAIKLDNKEEIEQNISDYEDQFFGTFYCDRMNFHIVDDPKNKLFGVTVESIILYFIDGKLCKTKYILDTDISDFLLKKYGSFKIVAKDEKNQNILLNQKTVVRNASGISLNDSFDNYKLKWSKEEKEIMYKVSLNSDKKYEYVEQKSNYNQHFGQVKKQCR